MNDQGKRSVDSGVAQLNMDMCDKSSHHSPSDELRFKMVVSSGIVSHGDDRIDVRRPCQHVSDWKDLARPSLFTQRSG